MSVSVLVGENALFHCAGNGVGITWSVDGSLATDSIIVNRGIGQHTVTSPSSGTVQSTSHYTSNTSEQWHYCTVCDLSW